MSQPSLCQIIMGQIETYFEEGFDFFNSLIDDTGATVCFKIILFVN